MAINRHAVEVGVLAGIGNLLIFQHFMPPVVDVRTSPSFDKDIEGSERTALLAGTAFTVLVAGFVRSWETFIVAGGMLAAIDFAFKHANAVTPETGKMANGGGGGGNLADGSIHPLPDYQEAG